jgi:Protein of unknown function (DUF1493)
MLVKMKIAPIDFSEKERQEISFKINLKAQTTFDDLHDILDDFSNRYNITHTDSTSLKNYVECMLTRNQVALCVKSFILKIQTKFRSARFMLNKLRSEFLGISDVGKRIEIFENALVKEREKLEHKIYIKLA